MAKLFTVFAELALDAGNFNKGISSAVKQGRGMASTLSTGMQQVSAKTIALGNAMYDLGKQAARAVKNFAKDAVGAYSEAEQLMGGVETLFKNSASTVIKNARNAYMSAGMDANEYMQTVMGFTSSLLQSLGGDTQQAAKYADMAVRDMSDNANKFGTDMAAIQNAYAGFSKQNYTMLDNLKLGYGGTRTEMERLLKDAQAIQRANGNNVEYNINRLSDVYDAIHVIQESLGVTGTTAKEASKTIAGSFNAFKASWKNVIIGMGTGEEMDVLIDNLFDTGTTLVNNVLALVPRIGAQALSAVHNTLQRFDLYRTLSNAYKVGKWQGLASAAIASFKRGVVGFGEWAIEKGSEFLGGLWDGLSGDKESAEKIKTFMNELFGAAGVVLTGLKESAVTALQWVKENGTAVASAVGPMTAAFTALELATSPLALALTGIIAFTTDWAAFEEKAPSVVSFFEDLSGIDFTTFVSGIEKVKEVISGITQYLDDNPEMVSGLSALATGLAIATGHPVAAVGALSTGVSSANEAAERFATEQATMDEWAQQNGYTRSERPRFLFWEYGEPDYPVEAYEAYERYKMQNAVEQMNNAAPAGLPSSGSGAGGGSSPLIPTGDAASELSSEISALSAAIEMLPAAVEAAATASVTNVTVEMDGETVGRLVSNRLSREYRRAAITTS